MRTSLLFPNQLFSIFLIIVYTLLELPIYLCNSTRPTNEGSSTLKLVFVIYRHGDRAPITLYPTDPNLASSWPEGLGQLTNLGKKQHYNLGEYLRTRYEDYLGDDQRELYVRSSGVERCLESAQTNVAALYRPKGLWVWNPNLNWQPMPIYTVPKEEDALLYDAATCPEADKEMERIKNSPEAKKFDEEHQELFDFVRKNSGDEKVKSWTKLGYIFDTLKIEKLDNLIVPDWANSVWQNMSEVQRFGFYIDSSTQLIQRLRGGPLIGEIISIMEKKVKKQTPAQKTTYKMYMYSTHDTVVTSVLSALNVFNRLVVPYFGTLLLELHENDPHNHVVRLFYRNSTLHDPYPLTLPGCETDCPLGHFVRLTEDIIPVDWKAECGLQTQSELFSVIALIIIGMMGMILVLIMISATIMLCLRCHKEKAGVRYHRVPETST